MIKAIVSLLAAGALSAAAAAGIPEDFERGYELALDKGCFDCHDLGYRLVGPSFRSIAQRYRFDESQRQRLPGVIRGGSIGHWGDRFAMWPQRNLDDQEVRTLVDWVLSQ
jgi:cytochrome c